MDELIGNLKTYKTLNKLGKLKDKPKEEKNLVLKATKGTHRTKEDEITYIAKWVLKSLKMLGTLSIRGESFNHFNEEKRNGTCHKYDKLGHFNKDCPIHKVE